MPTERVVKPGDLATPWNRFAAMACDTDHGLHGAGDGVLTREELREHISKLEAEANVAGYDMADILDSEVRDARRALRDMDLVSADAVEYLPENCRDLPVHLRRRATEMLMIDDRDAYGDVSPELVEAARRRYRQMGSVPSRAAQSSKEQALRELDEIEEHLFP